MGWCVVVGCKKNTFKEDRDRDVTFFPIPKDEQLRKVWLANIKRENPPKKPSICHYHFQESCFKRDLKV